jgi:GST-like protein
MFGMGDVGPMFGQLVHFGKFAGSWIEAPRPRERYIAEAKRLPAVIEGALNGQEWIAGAYSMAAIALAPWLAGLEHCGVQAVVGWHDLPNTNAYLYRFLARPAVKTGRVAPPREG